MKRLAALVLCVVACGMLAACARTSDPATDAANPALDSRIAALEQRVDALATRVEELTPETAVLMAQIQIQHAKLYYSGRERNWTLAGYALHELNEALQALQTFNDQFEDFPTPLSEFVPSLVGSPLGQLHSAIRARDKTRFDAAFESLTLACNACHATLNYAFIQVQAPTQSEFTNQKFTP